MHTQKKTFTNSFRDFFLNTLTPDLLFEFFIKSLPLNALY